MWVQLKNWGADREAFVKMSSYCMYHCDPDLIWRSNLKEYPHINLSKLDISPTFFFLDLPFICFSRVIAL